MTDLGGGLVLLRSGRSGILPIGCSRVTNQLFDMQQCRSECNKLFGGKISKLFGFADVPEYPFATFLKIGDGRRGIVWHIHSPAIHGCKIFVAAIIMAAGFKGKTGRSSESSHLLP